MHNIVSKTTVSFSNVVGPQEEISLYGHPLAYVAPTVYGAPQVSVSVCVHFSDIYIYISFKFYVNILSKLHLFCGHICRH